MAINPKPLRKLAKRFFKNRVREKHFRQTFSRENFTLGNTCSYILYKRKVIPVDFTTWTVWFEVYSRTRGRVLKSTQVDKDIRVSTVFLGVDHRFNFSGDDGPPILFETMIFGGQHDQYQDRYCTYDQALAGHQRACELAFEVAQ